MKKVLSMLLAVALLLMAVPVGVMPVAAATGNTTEFAGGSGTAEDPYLISTKYHLDNVRFYLSAHFKLINDIEFTDADFVEDGSFYNNGLGWEPIGYTTDSFTGIFDGDYHTVKNLYVNNTENYIGFFGTISGESAVVKNLYLTDIDVTGNNFTGGVAGRTINATVEGCYIEGTITGNNYVGGAVGQMQENSFISLCSVQGGVKGAEYVGGICGSANAYDNSSSRIHITATVSLCTNAASVSGQSYVGGILGEQRIRCAYETEWVPSSTQSWKGKTVLVWWAKKTVDVSNCYNKGDINAETGSCAGIVGTVNSTSLGFKDEAIFDGKIINCYNVGTTSGYGLSPNHERLVITDSYYLLDCCQQASGGIAKTHNQMRTQASFSNWNFDSVWTMGGDTDYLYPELQHFTLSGELGIKGDAAYLSTVEPDLSKINRVDDTFTYEWLIDDVIVGTGASYILTASDVGKTLQCKVVSTKNYNIGTLYSDGVMVSKAVQPDRPIVPELLMLNDNAFEITTNPNQEYSIDNVNWQSSGVFENLDPNKDYTVYSRILENDLYLLGESVPVLNVTTNRRPLYGTVALVGTSRFGDTLTVDVSGVMPKNATYSYEWKANGVIVSTDTSYTITKDDLGKNITVSVKGNGDFIGTLTSPAVTATKTTVQLPNAPVVQEVTNTSILLVEKAGYEYSMDTNFWQDSPLFEGLAAATEYTFYQRVKETDTTFASKASNGVEVVTLKNTIDPPEKPVLETVTNNSITVKARAGYEYSLDGITWQQSNVFTGLSPNTEYCFCQRIAEDATHYASGQSGFEWATTLKNTITTPAAPTVQEATDSSVTLVAIHGYEYSLDGSVWQDSPVFNNLTTLTTYTFYQRVAETRTDYASATSKPLSFKVKHIAQRPHAPTLKEKDNNSIEVEYMDGYEYSMDGQNWSTNSIFDGLQPNTQYSIYCRIPETDTHYHSEVSAALTVTTLKNTVNAPSAPVVSSKTDTSVTLVANSAYEYSKDGTTWQKSNVFSGLSPNTEYTFCQRKAETDTDYASEKSIGVTVSTYKICEVNPQYHVYTSACDDSCNECGAFRKVPDHIYDNACDDTCNVANCGFVRTVGDHVYDHACDTNCNICGATRTITHNYTAATCTKAKTCTVCGETEGSALGHDYASATCSKAKTCTACGATSGSKLGHSYEKVVTKATATKNGTIKSVCTRCDYTANKVTTIYKASKVSLSKTSYTYNGKVQKPTVTVKDSAGNTISSSNYTVTYASGCKNVGTYKVTITFKGNYSGTKTLSYKITHVSISQCKITLSKTTYAYNGKVQKPTVTVKSASGTKLSTASYTVTYASGCKNVGTYKITVKMKGNYSGSKTLTFTIKPTTKTSTSLLIGGTSSIGAKSNKTITYSTSNKSVVTVSSKGVITAKKAGTATISVKSNGITQKINVTVKTPYVKISGSNSMVLKKSVALKATSNTSATVKWSTSNSKVATVSSSGKVTGQKAGSATIYAKITYKGKTYTGRYTVTVKNPSLTLSKTSVTIYVGDTYTLTATSSPGATVKFKSSNTSVATVSSSGRITPKAKGSATITAYFTYAGKTYSKTCKVTVKKSDFRTVKNYITKNGITNSSGQKMIGFYDTSKSSTYYFTIAYNSKKDCLVFTLVADGSASQSMTFEYKEGQSYIDVTMLIDLGLSSATVTYDLKVSSYSNDSSFTYYIKTVGYLYPDDYKKVVGSFNDLAFNGWALLLMSETGVSLNDLGFKNF